MSGKETFTVNTAYQGYVFLGCAQGRFTMTLNYYAHATFASAKAEMERLIA